MVNDHPKRVTGHKSAHITLSDLFGQMQGLLESERNRLGTQFENRMFEDGQEDIDRSWFHHVLMMVVTMIRTFNSKKVVLVELSW